MAKETNIVYLNGEYLPVEEATISVMVFGGRLLRLEDHLNRLQHSLNRISLDSPNYDEGWKSIFATLLEKNPGDDRAVYLQVTRGAYPKRDLAIDSQYPATVFAMILQVKEPDLDVMSAGISAVTVEDFRWNACDIKSTSLVANVMLKQQAAQANVDDAILIKHGLVTEGTASNVFLVKDGKLITPPTGHQLLPGITRDLVLEIAENNAIFIEEREIREAELYEADEIWMTSSTREIAPVIRLNAEDVGAGKAGEMWELVMDLYQQCKQSLRAGV